MPTMRKRPAGLLIDLDGTVWDGDALIAGADEAVARLRAGGSVSFRHQHDAGPAQHDCGVARSRRHLAEAGEIFTPPLAAASWLGGRDSTYSALSASAYIRGVCRLHIGEGRPKLWSWGHGRGLDDPSHESGVPLAAGRRGVPGASQEPILEDVGWVVSGRRGLRRGPRVCNGPIGDAGGKPSRPLFEAAAQHMGLGLEDVAMIGDSMSSDIAGAKAAGSQGILVRTGKYSADEVAGAGVPPDLIVDSLAAVPDLLLSGA